MANGFARLARAAAYATALAGLIYSIAFVVVVQRGSSGAEWTAAVAFTAGGLLALPVLVAVTTVLGEPVAAAAAARLALVLGGVATVMTSLHGAYDLSVLAKPESATAGDISPHGTAQHDRPSTSLRGVGRSGWTGVSGCFASGSTRRRRS